MNAEQSDIKLVLSTSREDEEWDSFVAASQDGHHVQTSMWARVKATLGWEPVRLIFRKADGIVAGAQVLVKRYPLVGKVAYVTKGPLLRGHDPLLAQRLIDELLRLSRKQGFRMLAIQPPNNGHALTPLLEERGFRPSTLELAPVATVLIDCSLSENELLFQLNRKTRQSLYQSRRTDLTVRAGTEADLSTFYRLHLSTSKRQNFLPYPKSYFEAMQSAFSPRGHFQILLAEYQGQPVSANLVIPYRDTVIAKLMGWSGEHRETRPNEALHWEIVCWAKRNGYRYVDLEGVDVKGARLFLSGQPLPEEVRRSPDQLKYGFGGRVVLYPAACEMIFNPINRWLYYRLRPQVARQTLISKILDIFRKR